MYYSRAEKNAEEWNDKSAIDKQQKQRLYTLMQCPYVSVGLPRDISLNYADC